MNAKAKGSRNEHRSRRLLGGGKSARPKKRALKTTPDDSAGSPSNHLAQLLRDAGMTEPLYRVEELVLIFKREPKTIKNMLYFHRLPYEVDRHGKRRLIMIPATSVRQLGAIFRARRSNRFSFLTYPERVERLAERSAKPRRRVSRALMLKP